MSSPASQRYEGSFLGAAADVTVSVIPFPPQAIQFISESAGVYGMKTYAMPGNEYVSQLGADTGITLTESGFVAANGADVNVNGSRTHYIALG